MVIVILLLQFVTFVNVLNVEVVTNMEKQNELVLPNLTTLKWAHAVNSQEKLNEALKDDVDYIEADIVLGTLNKTSEIIPIMAHPPANTSDLSLESFLKQIHTFNNEEIQHKKGIKLDFKSIESFEAALNIIKKEISDAYYPIWLNADIIKGPVNDIEHTPVDAERFLNGSKQFPKTVLSIGWTTKWSTHHIEGSYTTENTQAMLSVLKNTNIIKTNGQSITFPVRAGIAANSLSELHNLINTLNSTNNATLTVWSATDDYVDVEKLKQFISYIGKDKVYVDVPKSLADQLNLEN